MPPTPPEVLHRIVLDGQPVTYCLRRSSRRTIALRIDQLGLRVGAPLHARLDDIESLVRQHGRWVLDKLATWRERPPPATLQASDGSTLYLLGEVWTLRLREGRRTAWRFAANQLHLTVSPTVNALELLERALRAQARQHLGERLTHYAQRLDVPTPPLRLSSARTRWGSCSRQGGIALNWRLLFLQPGLVDYVVCHELAHLKEMNHGPRFWSVVEQLCPEWRERRQALREHTIAILP